MKSFPHTSINHLPCMPHPTPWSFSTFARTGRSLIFSSLSPVYANATSDRRKRGLPLFWPLDQQTKSLYSHYTSDFQCIIRTPRPNLLPILKQHPRNRQQCHRNKTQQASRPANTESFIHLYREQREHSTQCIPQQAISRKCRSAVQSLVGINQVVGSREENREITPCERDRCHDWTSP